jgi:hypothetical protein
VQYEQCIDGELGCGSEQHWRGPVKNQGRGNAGPSLSNSAGPGQQWVDSKGSKEE